MSNLRYEEPEPSRPQDVIAALDRGDPFGASKALIGAAMHHEEWRDVQELCLRLLEGEDRNVAATAATALGHLARIHGELDVDIVRPILQRYLGDEIVGPRAEDALDDIRHYIG